MSIVYLLVLIGMLMTFLGVAWFIWSVRSGQYDDLDTPSYRMLFDDDQLKQDKTRDDD